MEAARPSSTSDRFEPLPPEAADLPADVARVSWAALLGLGLAASAIIPLVKRGPLAYALVALGLAYPLHRTWRAGRDYQRIAPAHPSRFPRLAAAFAAALAGAAAPGAFGVPLRLALLLAAATLGTLTLASLLALRAAALERLGAAAGFTPPAVHLTLFLVGCVTLPVGVGLLVLGAAAALFFVEHGKLCSAVVRARTPRPQPATPVYGVSLAPAAYCKQCGGALAAGGLLCTGCGKPA